MPYAGNRLFHTAYDIKLVARGGYGYDVANYQVARVAVLVLVDGNGTEGLHRAAFVCGCESVDESFVVSCGIGEPLDEVSAVVAFDIVVDAYRRALVKPERCPGNRYIGVFAEVEQKHARALQELVGNPEGDIYVIGPARRAFYEGHGVAEEVYLGLLVLVPYELVRRRLRRRRRKPYGYPLVALEGCLVNGAVAVAGVARKFAVIVVICGTGEEVYIGGEVGPCGKLLRIGVAVAADKEPGRYGVIGRVHFNPGFAVIDGRDADIARRVYPEQYQSLLAAVYEFYGPCRHRKAALAVLLVYGYFLAGFALPLLAVGIQVGHGVGAEGCKVVVVMYGGNELGVAAHKGVNVLARLRRSERALEGKVNRVAYRVPRAALYGSAQARRLYEYGVFGRRAVYLNSYRVLHDIGCAALAGRPSVVEFDEKLGHDNYLGGVAHAFVYGKFGLIVIDGYFLPVVVQFGYGLVAAVGGHNGKEPLGRVVDVLAGRIVLKGRVVLPIYAVGGRGAA